MRKIICVILALFLASSAAFAGYQIFREYTERQESADTYTDLENLISFPEVLPEEEPDETNLSESGETEPAPVGPTIDFAGLEEINEDCVAWIYIEDTAINYPVVQGSDNSYYLKHLIDGKWNSAGCIFLDSRVDSDISDRHSITVAHSLFKKGRSITVADHLCKVRGIKCVCISARNDPEIICVLIKKALRSIHIYITSDNMADIETARRRFEQWRKQR